MEKFKISSNNQKTNSINRTIRIRPEIFDRLTELSEQNNISLNKLVNQCLDYALQNLEE